jgi:hypothetical protein
MLGGASSDTQWYCPVMSQSHSSICDYIRQDTSSCRKPVQAASAQRSFDDERDYEAHIDAISAKDVYTKVMPMTPAINAQNTMAVPPSCRAYTDKTGSISHATKTKASVS